MFGHSPFSFLTFAESPVNAQVTLTGVEARGNEDLGGARHAEYFVPDDSDNPNITVMAFEDSTTVSADGSSLGTISSAGGTLTVSASNYENKIISADKPITLQSGDNQTVGVPTSWAGTSFGFRNTRVGFVLQMRALYGTASVEIFKDGVSTTTLSVGSTATTTQSYADDASDPEYTVFSDLPIIVFKTRATNLSGDSRPAFPATTDFLYGTSSNNAASIRVDGYGATAVSWNRFDSNGGSASETISTVKVTASFASGQDFSGPTNRIQAAKAITAFQIGDSDGGEKTSFIPEGCFAHEFRLIEAAEFVNFIGAPGTNGRNIDVYNSSGTLVDTIQLATSNTGSDFPTKFQLISSTTTDSNLTGNAKSYALTAGMRFVSEVPVGAVVEDDSSNRESNLFGLRYFGGLASGAASASLTGVVATGAIQPVATTGFEIDITEILASVSATGSVGTVEAKTQEALGSVSATGAVNTVTVNILEALNSVSATGAISTVGVGNSAGLTGVGGTANTPAVQPNVTEILASVSATGTVNSVVINRVAIIGGVSATGSVNTVEPKITEILTGVSATGSVGTFTIANTVTPTGVSATGAIQNVAVTGFEIDVSEVLNSVSATGAISAVQPNITEILASVSGTSSTNAVVLKANSKITLASVSATGAVGTLEAKST